MNKDEQSLPPQSKTEFQKNIFLAASLLLNLMLVLSIVWVHSMPYVNLSRAIREASQEHRKLSDLSSQLEAERNVMGNQASLENKIRTLGLDLFRPRPGQVRRLE